MADNYLLCKLNIHILANEPVVIMAETPISLKRFRWGWSERMKLANGGTGAMTGDWHILICMPFTSDLHTDQLEMID